MRHLATIILLAFFLCLPIAAYGQNNSQSPAETACEFMLKQKPDAHLQVKLNSGQTINGTLVKLTMQEFELATNGRTIEIAYSDVREIKNVPSLAGRLHRDIHFVGKRVVRDLKFTGQVGLGVATLPVVIPVLIGYGLTHSD